MKNLIGPKEGEYLFYSHHVRSFSCIVVIRLVFAKQIKEELRLGELDPFTGKKSGAKRSSRLF